MRERTRERPDLSDWVQVPEGALPRADEYPQDESTTRAGGPRNNVIQRVAVPPVEPGGTGGERVGTRLETLRYSCPEKVGARDSPRVECPRFFTGGAEVIFASFDQTIPCTSYISLVMCLLNKKWKILI